MLFHILKSGIKNSKYFSFSRESMENVYWLLLLLLVSHDERKKLQLCLHISETKFRVFPYLCQFFQVFEQKAALSVPVRNKTVDVLLIIYAMKTSCAINIHFKD